jgi:AraC-like DNA-binding protein
VHVGLPTRHLTCIVTVDTPVQVSDTPAASRPPRPFDALVGGLHSAPAFIHHDGVQHGVQLEVTPLGARALFGVPPSALAERVVALDDVLGRRGDELVDRLRAAPTWPGRFAALDAVLTGVLRGHERPGTCLSRAWARLVDTGGTVQVGALADELGWSRRHLSERFRREFGLTPKTAARVIRFERARLLVTRHDRPTLGQVAAACGYADQAHMVRDWHDFAGASPTGWMAAEALPLLQDADAVPAASCDHD